MKYLIVLSSVLVTSLTVQAQYKMTLAQALKKASGTTRIEQNECHITTKAIEDIEHYRKTVMRVESQTIILLNILKENNECLKLDRNLNEPNSLVRQLIDPANQSESAISLINEYVSSTARLSASFLAALKVASDTTRVNVNECNLDIQTVDQIEMYRSAALPTKIKYVSLKGLLTEANECLQLDLANGEQAELAKALLNHDNASEKAIDIINEFLAQ